MTRPPGGIAAARADLCRLLAACYYEPGPEFLEERLFDSMRKAAAAVDPALAELAVAVGASFEGTPMLDLRVEYTRLFLNPTGPISPPYESAWIGGKDPAVAQRTVEVVTSFYSAAGFQIAEDFRDLPDHIAAELEFLYAAIFREAAAVAAADSEAEGLAKELQGRFMASHLGCWASPFLQSVREEAQVSFYRHLAELTALFLRTFKP